MFDSYIAFLENIKNSEEKKQYWLLILRDFRRVYTPNGELNLFKHMLTAKIPINADDFFENRKLISYLYSKGILSTEPCDNCVDLGGAIAKAKQAGKNSIIIDSHRFLTKLLKMNIKNLRREIRNTASLFKSKNIFLDPYKLLYDLNIMASSDKKHIRAVQEKWIESLMKEGEQ